jgi:hypothetical protein
MKEFTAVLHLKSKVPQKVASLSAKVESSLTANAKIFSESDPTLVAFSAEVTKLDTAISAKDGSKVKNQEIIDQTEVVYGMLKSLVVYVNKVAKGDKAIILLSGFDCSNEPTYHDIPGKAMIRRVEDGSTIQSVKLYVESLEYADRYKVEVATNQNGPWTTTLDFASLNRLEFTGERGKEILIRVSGGNCYGWGIPSDAASFIPR